MKEYTFDERRKIALPGSEEETLAFCVDHWIKLANSAIADHGFFAVALSGGSTPKKIFQRLSSPENASKIDWSKVYLFWSDERSVPPDHPDSNYKMAMEEGNLSILSIPKDHIFRMEAEQYHEGSAEAYEKLIKEVLKGDRFDLIMLGIGEDGHTASLFPHTSALEVKGRLVVANHVPQKKSWRVTFTYELINAANNICFYVLGAGKAAIVEQVLTSPLQFYDFPSQNVGTDEHPALWIIDEAASKNILVLLQ